VFTLILWLIILLEGGRLIMLVL